MQTKTKILLSKDVEKQIPFESLDAIPLPILLSQSLLGADASQRPQTLHRFVNKAFIAEIGYTIDEMPDIQMWFELAYPDLDYRAEIVLGWNRAVEKSINQGLNIAEMTALIQCKNGHKKWFTVIAQIQAENLHVVTFRDVHELMCAVEENSRLSHTDLLTNLANRRKVIDRLGHELTLFGKTTKPFSVVLCDIDYFKVINDTYGHATGDVVLRKVAETLRNTCREIDCVARWGGEEFLVVLPLTKKHAALKLAERLRQAVENLSCKNETADLSVTISIGCAISLNGSSVESLINAADKALYQAKAKGRNRVCG